MAKNPSMVDLINHNMNNVKTIGVGHLYTENQQLTGTNICINSKDIIHFGSCSYLNLEIDQRLKDAAIAAIEKYGIQFSCSRAYLSIPLYEELENLLSKVFGGPTLLTPTSTLGHLANIPILTGRNDVIILDHQVHNSVQNAAKVAAAAGTQLEMMRHNNLEYLDRRIEKLKKDHDQIWYMADGIYSMFGDECPIQDLYQLMEKHEQLHLYIDDAHGMSWTGKHGRGFILGQVELHPRMVVVTSLCKGFGASGGATIFHNSEIATKVRNCGSTHIFSSPLQPAILAAASASAKIHLSPELDAMQAQLKENVEFFQHTARQLQLPLIDFSATPIQYIGAGEPEMALQLCRRLLDKGYYTCVAGYPSVPFNNCGVRITINRLHTKKQIFKMLHTLSETMNEVLHELNYSREAIFKAFRSKKKISKSTKKIFHSKY